MIWILVPLASIIAWVIVESAKHRAAGADANLLIEALAEQLDEAREERQKLQKRVENLEAIVTSETYELEREALKAGIGRVDPGLLPEDSGFQERRSEAHQRRREQTG